MHSVVEYILVQNLFLLHPGILENSLFPHANGHSRTIHCVILVAAHHYMALVEQAPKMSLTLSIEDIVEDFPRYEVAVILATGLRIDPKRSMETHQNAQAVNGYCLIEDAKPNYY